VAAWLAGFGALICPMQGQFARADDAPSGGGESRDGRVRAKALLDESHWTVELERMFADEAQAAVPDTLIFSKGHLTSAQFTGLGYSAGPFSLSIGTTGLPVWEATQLNPNDGIVIWRGELDRDVIRGTVSRLPLEGASENFRFEGKETLAGAPPAPPSTSEASSPVSASEASSEVPGSPAAQPDSAPAPVSTKKPDTSGKRDDASQSPEAK
jgi:hypothetical protein